MIDEKFDAIVVGAGMAGLACGRALADRGHSVALFDKGRRPGGRMAARTTDTPLGPVGFDHGAPYMTARDAGFRDAVAAWRSECPATSTSPSSAANRPVSTWNNVDLPAPLGPSSATNSPGCNCIDNDCRAVCLP